MRLENLAIDISNLNIISNELAHHFNIIPKQSEHSNLVFYTSKSENAQTKQEELELLLGKTIHFDFIDLETLTSLLGIHYKNTLKNTITNSNINVKDNDFLENLIFEAKKIDSSDIHFEVYEKVARVRLRIDGVLIEKHTIEKENYLELVNKIKIKASLDITEKRLPQDGRINYDNFDIRVSILPTLHGEKIVMRILGKDTKSIQIKSLGLSSLEYNHYLESVKKPNGIVLISGPTGSGKTTTLYATLKELNNNTRNIVTVEDPIEYTLEGINQVQLKEDIGLGFTSALRSFLRQDPDIIMLGEIRDAETAKMAIRASLTGHLVLSTIHTNSALGTISRLIDMGIPSFLIAETLNISVAQRLIRNLCPSCKEKTEAQTSELPLSFTPPYTIKEQYIAIGCNDCFYTGYKGRRAIYEIIPIDREISKNIKEEKLTNDILPDNFQTLAIKAYELYASGITSLEEIYPILING